MSREKRQNTWNATLPGDRKVSGVLPDSLLTERAIELVPKTMDGKPAAVQRKTTSNLLRVCIREVDGEATSFDKLRGRNFDKLFDPKERGFLTQMFKRLTQPTQAEQEYFNDSLHLSSEDGSYRWYGKILENEDLRRIDDIDTELRDLRGEYDHLSESSEKALKLSSEIKTLEDKRADIADGAFEVSGVLPGTDETDRSVEQVPSDKQKRGPLAQKIAAENLLRNCIKSYTDEESGERVSLSYPKLRGTKLDDEFSPKEQQIILVGMLEHSEPTQDEVEDFMATVTVK